MCARSRKNTLPSGDMRLESGAAGNGPVAARSGPPGQPRRARRWAKIATDNMTWQNTYGTPAACPLHTDDAPL
eukprot:13734673-Heterocapsa_arctica.AAC.1